MKLSTAIKQADAAYVISYINQLQCNVKVSKRVALALVDEVRNITDEYEPGSFTADNGETVGYLDLNTNKIFLGN